MASIETIEGIGVRNGKALRKAGVRSTAALLKSAGSKKGRRACAAETGCTEAQLLEVNTAKKRNLVRRPPSLGEVERWVAHAGTLEAAVSH